MKYLGISLNVIFLPVISYLVSSAGIRGIIKSGNIPVESEKVSPGLIVSGNNPEVELKK